MTAAQQPADGEEWRPIPIVPGYWASRQGQIRCPKGLILNAKPHYRDHYPQVNVYIDGARTVRVVHRLVAAAFLGERPAELQVRHLDGNRANASADNLRYGTAKENAADRTAHGTHRAMRITACPKGHPYDAENTYVTPKGKRDCRACRRASSARRQQRIYNPTPPPPPAPLTPPRITAAWPPRPVQHSAS